MDDDLLGNFSTLVIKKQNGCRGRRGNVDITEVISLGTIFAGKADDKKYPYLTLKAS